MDRSRCCGHSRPLPRPRTLPRARLPVGTARAAAESSCSSTTSSSCGGGQSFGRHSFRRACDGACGGACGVDVVDRRALRLRPLLLLGMQVRPLCNRILWWFDSPSLFKPRLCAVRSEAHAPCPCKEWGLWKAAVAEMVAKVRAAADQAAELSGKQACARGEGGPAAAAGSEAELADLGSLLWLAANTKKCPKCQTSTEKSEGWCPSRPHNVTHTTFWVVGIHLLK